MSTKDTSTSSSKDIKFLRLAEHFASWSKDPSTKVGAVAVGSKGQVLAQGYNGFPRGIDDSLTRYLRKEEKYKLIVHAEMNVIYNASYNGSSLDGATLYVWGLPVCSECAKGIIQTGITRVVMPQQTVPERWQASWKITQEMLTEAQIKWEFINVSNTRLD